MKRKFYIGLAVGLLTVNFVVIGNAMTPPLMQTTDTQAQTPKPPKRTKRNKVKRATDDAARGTGQSVATASKDTAKGTKDVAKDTSRAAAKGVAKTGKATAKVSKKVGRAFKGKKPKA